MGATLSKLEETFVEGRDILKTVDIELDFILTIPSY